MCKSLPPQPNSIFCWFSAVHVSEHTHTLGEQHSVHSWPGMCRNTSTVPNRFHSGQRVNVLWCTTWKLSWKSQKSARSAWLHHSSAMKCGPIKAFAWNPKKCHWRQSQNAHLKQLPCPCPIFPQAWSGISFKASALERPKIKSGTVIPNLTLDPFRFYNTGVTVILIKCIHYIAKSIHSRDIPFLIHRV